MKLSHAPPEPPENLWMDSLGLMVGKFFRAWASYRSVGMAEPGLDDGWIRMACIASEDDLQPI
jgi:hypothetical protein